MSTDTSRRQAAHLPADEIGPITAAVTATDIDGGLWLALTQDGLVVARSIHHGEPSMAALPVVTVLTEQDAAAYTSDRDAAVRYLTDYLVMVADYEPSEIAAES